MSIPRLAGTPFLALAFLIFLMGCAGGAPSMTSGNQPQPPVPPAPTQPPPIPQQSGSVTISPQNAAAAPGQTVHFTASSTIAGTVAYSAQCNGSAATIDTSGNFIAPSVSQSENCVVQASLAGSPANSASAVVAVIAPGVVTGTSNPLVAEYSIYLPQPGGMAVQFGPDTGYGRSTWSQPTTSNYGGEIQMEVAGMRGSSTYHMQSEITLANGVTFQDSDHTFTTGAAPPTVPVQVSMPSGQTPQPGIELFDTVPLGSKPIANLNQAFATDLQGNTIWTYSYKGSAANIIFPIKPLPNGHFLLVIGYVAAPAATQNVPSGTISVVREVDLIGNTIRELSIDQLNKSLAASGYSGLNLLTFCTDFLTLPNGHMILNAWMTKPYTNPPGHPAGTYNLLGNVLIDVDQNFNPTWVWNSFDHLDVNRDPYMFPDLTHANSLLYSPDDHDLLLSVRQQNWIVKIDYQDGKGTGDVLWRLGEGGDFKLLGGTDPEDWFYAQHGINFFSANTSGIFTLGIMDNGNDRLLANGQTCGTTGAPSCYSRAITMQLDETAKTATLGFQYPSSASPIYSYFGGQTDQLSNNDVETDFCASQGGATVLELDPTQTPAQTVWQARTPGYDQYRVVRIQSLYPGVQW